MAMNMEVSFSDAFLFVVVGGEMNSKSCERMLKTAFGEAARKAVSKILIDGSRVTGTLSAEERVELGTRLADQVKSRGLEPTVAFVGHAPTFDGLGVAAIRKQGVNLKMFESIPDGLAWLQGCEHQ